jgi:hypothetical protein
MGLFCLAGNMVKISIRYITNKPCLFESISFFFFCTGVIWPEGGEIDIVEGVNLMTQNQIALHTVNG